MKGQFVLSSVKSSGTKKQEEKRGWFGKSCHLPTDATFPAWSSQPIEPAADAWAALF